MNNLFYIDTSEWEGFVRSLKKDWRVFSPSVKDSAAKETEYYYQGISSYEPFVYNAYRTVEPLKSFFTPASEKATDYFTPEKDMADAKKGAVIFGVKSCDITGRKVQDFVFLDGVDVDSAYRSRRENTILVSGDCTGFKQVCHCLAWDILPHPTEGFDLNISPLNDGYIVEIGSEKGERLLGGHRQHFVAAKDTQIQARRRERDGLIERLRRHISPQKLVSRSGVQELVRKGYNADTWKQFMAACVECGGCNFICDTCHCFLLADKREGLQNKKVRVWDSCLYANYAAVAGGANPLKTRAQRLRNRFMKKFDFFVDNLGMPACCGCGRCIEVCPGKIDIREVLSKLSAI